MTDKTYCAARHCYHSASTPAGYCKTHDPERVAARRAKREAERRECLDARMASRDRANAISTARDRVIDAVLAASLSADPADKLPADVLAALGTWRKARGY